jgi:DtxR family Mn-dependent transcriptional regulator
MLSNTEENYLKALVHLTIEKGLKDAGTNELAQLLGVKPATATDMLKKLKTKKLVDYKKYGRITITSPGRKHAIEVIRKHRLWETFLFEKLHFSWDEVHEVAEQLEHIQSKKLIDELDRLLGFPSVDPHGEPIPSSKGELKVKPRITLAEAALKTTHIVMGVNDDHAEFLQYVDKVGCKIGAKIKVIQRHAFDDSHELEINGKRALVTAKFAQQIFVA